MEEKNDKTVDEEQTSILENIIKPENSLSIKVKVPKDTFKDELVRENIGFSSGIGGQSESSFNTKIQKKFGYSFNVSGFESNSVAYFNEMLLGYKSMNNCVHVNFNFNEFLSIDLPTINYCKKMLNPEFEVVGDIDGVIKDVTNDILKKAKGDNPYSIFTSKNFFNNNQNIYDIFCESTFGLIEKLKRDSVKKPNQKLIQLKKLIFLINFINEINEKINNNSNDKEKHLKNIINSTFHHKEGNKIILSIIVDGNYKFLIEQIKNSCLFSKDWKDNNENGVVVKNLYKYFSMLKNSKIPFLIIYCPRFYERNSKYFNPITKLYDEDVKEEVEIRLQQQEMKIQEQAGIIENMKKEMQKIMDEFKFLEKKRNRPGARKKIKKKKKANDDIGKKEKKEESS